MAASLRAMREAASLSKREAAAKLGITCPSLHAWEIGKARPSLEKIIPLANLYRRPVEDILEAATRKA